MRIGLLIKMKPPQVEMGLIKIILWWNTSWNADCPMRRLPRPKVLHQNGGAQTSVSLFREWFLFYVDGMWASTRGGRGQSQVDALYGRSKAWFSCGRHKWMTPQTSRNGVPYILFSHSVPVVLPNLRLHHCLNHAKRQLQRRLFGLKSDNHGSTCS